MNIEEISTQRLKRAKLRTTRHRVRVLSVLELAQRPLTHLEILQSIPEQNLDRVTLYRILASLTEASLVHQIQGFDGTWRFCSHDDETDKCPGGHPHLLCSKCGIMWCMPEVKLQHIDVPEGFHVTHKQMVIVGVCKECQSSPRPRVCSPNSQENAHNKSN